MSAGLLKAIRMESTRGVDSARNALAPRAKAGEVVEGARHTGDRKRPFASASRLWLFT
jgi:hypothetical protein